MQFLRKIWKIIKYYFSKNLVVIYQMGKVGSTALEGLDLDTVHVHTLYGGKKWLLGKYEKPLEPKLLKIFKNILLRIRFKFGPKVKVVSFVRKPHQRNVSYFFQRLYVDLNYYIQGDNVDPRKEGFGFLIDAFNYSVVNTKNYKYDEWFDNEIKASTGIDVFNSLFNKELGYKIYKNKKVELFVGVLEKTNIFEHELAMFLNIDKPISSSNRGSAKWYASVYEKFNNEYIASAEYEESLYSMKTFRCFY